jgi:hypothetical protein
MTDSFQPPVGERERMQWAIDILSIQQILARYVPGFDGQASESVARDFVEDGVLDISGYGALNGHAEIRAFIDAVDPTVPNGHFLSSPMIEITGDEAVATLTSLFFYRDGDHFKMLRLTAVRVELQRTGDVWKIVRRFNRVIDESGVGRGVYRKALHAPA